MGACRFSGEGEESFQTVIRLLDLLYPRHCTVCGCTLADSERCLCGKCMEDLPLTYFWQWRENPAEKILWGRCHFETVSSLFYYRRESPYSCLTPSIKYGGDRHLGIFLGEMLGRHLDGAAPHADAIIPVPVHPLKKWKRGYNQAEIIAEGIKRGMGGDIPLLTDILTRRRWSRSQTKTDVGNKWENVEGAFSARKGSEHLLRGKHILVVDDVLTTGATAEACWNALENVPELRISYSTLAFVE